MAITTIGTHGIGTDVIVAADIAANAVTASELADDAVGADELAANAVVNASVASGAAIALNKLATTTASRLLVSDGSGVITPSSVTTANLTDLTDSGATTLHSHAGGGPSQSTQSALVAETNEDTYAPPDLMKHHPGITKVWVMTNADGDIETPDYGCSTVGDSGLGNRRINFSQAFNGTKFGKQVTGDLAGGGERASGVSTAATDAMIYNSSNTLQDSETFFSAWGIF